MSTIAGQLEAWYATHARDLPWRRGTSSWGRLVSEFMLQQTQVSRVIDRWTAFMVRFPTPIAAAQATEQEMLAAWQGLGYYRRARMLHGAARTIVDRFEGEVPSTIADLQTLPGIGRYTAGAVASIAFGERTPIVDANVHRVLCRLHCHGGEASPSAWTWEQADVLVEDATDPAMLNEALMELGATICTPRRAECESCPIASDCRGKNDIESIPPPRKTTDRRRIHHHAVVMHQDGLIAFEQRPNEGLWGSMWQVPTVEADHSLETEVVARSIDSVTDLHEVASFEHVLTHRVVVFHVYQGRCTNDARFIWGKGGDSEDFPLANAQRKVLACVSVSQ